MLIMYNTMILSNEAPEHFYIVSFYMLIYVQVKQGYRRFVLYIYLFKKKQNNTGLQKTKGQALLVKCFLSHSGA